MSTTKIAQAQADVIAKVIDGHFIQDEYHQRRALVDSFVGEFVYRDPKFDARRFASRAGLMAQDVRELVRDHTGKR